MFQWKWEVDNQTTVEYQRKGFGNQSVIVNGKEFKSKFPMFGFKYNVDVVLGPYRKGRVEVSALGMKPEATLFVENQLIVPYSKDLPKCPGCAAENKVYDKFCMKCGEALPSMNVMESHRKVNEATKSLLWLAGMFVVFGVLMFFINNDNYDKSLQKLATYKANETLLINGVNYKVAELKEKILIERYSNLVMNVFLACIMIGLFFWSKKAPLAALLVATAIYLVINVGNAIYSPETIAQGIYMKIIIIGVLYKGIKSALEVRALKVSA
ncbi:MAG: zinc ribbon domain-containing protein [Rhizobacter sp.]|nr:zinc ribbon domain-containing protein [Bacteriovorax sp.]